MLAIVISLQQNIALRSKILNLSVLHSIAQKQVALGARRHCILLRSAATR